MNRRKVAGASLAVGSGDRVERLYGMVGRSPAMRRVYRRIEQLARLPIPVLILGESGTGKELVARAIWRISAPERPFVVVSCAAIPATLIESELFGHERGAFTGAVRRHVGLLAQADGGILFLDEIAELPLHAQAKLLRAIETHEYRLVGGEVRQRSQFRVIAATHRDLKAMVSSGRFRDDLLHRLGAARIVLPPLRERLEDLPMLVSHFLRSVEHANEHRSGVSLSEQALDLLRGADWPGNVRQLRNVIEAGVAMSASGVIEPGHLSEFLKGDGRELSTDQRCPLSLAEALASAEAAAIDRALQDAKGDRVLAARSLGISPATLYRKLRRLNGTRSGTDSQI